MNLNVNSNFPPQSQQTGDFKNDPPIAIFLISKIARSIESIVDNKNNSDFSKTAKIILDILISREGISQREISNLTNLKPPTISVTLQKLEDEDMIVKSHDKYDKRSIRLFFTEKGREYKNTYINKILIEEHKAFQGISEIDKKHFIRILHSINENLS